MKTKLQELFNSIEKEKRRIVLINNTKDIDADFREEEIKEARLKIKEYQEEFNKEYENQNN